MAEAHTVVRQLAALRRKSGLSQTALASDIGTKQSAISELESGVTAPNLTTLARYARRFDMEIVLTPTEPVDISGAAAVEDVRSALRLALAILPDEPAEVPGG